MSSQKSLIRTQLEEILKDIYDRKIMSVSCNGFIGQSAFCVIESWVFGGLVLLGHFGKMTMCLVRKPLVD